MGGRSTLKYDLFPADHSIRKELNVTSDVAALSISPYPVCRCARTVGDHEAILSSATHAVRVMAPDVGFAVVDVTEAFSQAGLRQEEEARKFLLPLASQTAKDAVQRVVRRFSRTSTESESDMSEGESESEEEKGAMEEENNRNLKKK